MNDYTGLLHRAKQGLLSEEEVAMVAGELRKPNPPADPYTLLHVLGRAGDARYRQLVEGYLGYEDDPMLARLSLQILCDFWGDTSRYLEEVQRYLKRASWDREDDVRTMAISIAGEYLRSHTNDRMLRELLAIYENEGERPGTRRAAYLALARVMGSTWEQLPPATRAFDLVSDTDARVLQQAEQRLRREKGG